MTDADRIARLEEENAWLRRELGDMVTANELHAIRRGIFMELKQATILLRLFHARGRVVPHAQLLDLLGEERSQITLKAHIWRLRKLYGADFVETSFGLGYYLSARGMEMVAGLLAQHQARAA